MAKPGRRIGTLLATAWLAALPLTLVPATAAASVAAPDAEAQLDFGYAYCNVKAEEPHYSTLSHDASFHTVVACYFNSGNGARFYAKKIKIDAEMTFFSPTEMRGGTVCHRTATRRNSYLYDFPCHGPYEGNGVYSGKAAVEVTARPGDTKSVRVVNVVDGMAMPAA